MIGTELFASDFHPTREHGSGKNDVFEIAHARMISRLTLCLLEVRENVRRPVQTDARTIRYFYSKRGEVPAK
jgi:hypothetical protein